LPDVHRAQFVAVMRAFHVSNRSRVRENADVL